MVYLTIHRGYTLLELLVVLLIFSLLSALVIPRLTTVYHSFQLAFTRDEIIAQIGSLGYQAFQQGQNLKLIRYPPDAIENVDAENVDAEKEIEKQQPLPLELPDGWQIHTETPVIFQANGVCRGGTVFVHYQEQVFRLLLEPPFCQPRR